MDKLLWKLLMWMWARRARKQYGGPGDNGELFCTANFQNAMQNTTNMVTGEQMASTCLIRNGYWRGYGGSHWYADETQAYDSFPESPGLK